MMLSSNSWKIVRRPAGQGPYRPGFQGTKRELSEIHVIDRRAAGLQSEELTLSHSAEATLPT